MSLVTDFAPPVIITRQLNSATLSRNLNKTAKTLRILAIRENLLC